MRACSDDRKYVRGCRLYACTNTRKFKGLDFTEITSLPEIKKVIYMARHFNISACSTQDPFAYSECLRQPTIAVLLPTLSTSILFTRSWTDLVCVLVATTGNTSAVAGYTRAQIHENSRASISQKLHHCRRSKKWFTWHVISTFPHAQHKTRLHTVNVYDSRPSQFY